MIGIISSFVTLAFVIQLMSIFLVRRKVNTKRLVVVFDTLSIFFFMMLYLIPFTPFVKQMKIALIVISIIFAYVSKYLIHSICFRWGNSFVDPATRAGFSAKKEMLSLFCGMIFTAAVGWVIDAYEGMEDLSGAFLFIAAALLILNICNLICLSAMKEEEDIEEEADERKSFSSVIKNTIGSKPFCKVIVLTIMWDAARYFTIGFMGVFKTKELMLSMVVVQGINIIANFARMLISIPFGRYSDKHSFAKGFCAALYMAAIAFGINIFTTPDKWWLVVAFTILYNCCIAGTNQNSFNITYNYVKKNYIVEAMAIKNSIGGICGFLASVAGSVLLDFIQCNGNRVFGIQIYGQQVLSGISFLITVAAIVFIKRKIEKEQTVVQ